MMRRWRQLLVQGQAVAGLAFDSRRTRGQGGAETGLDEGLEPCVVGGARGGDGAQDAATGVRRALQPRRGLVRSVAGEDGVGVAVDESGGDQR